MFRNEDDDVRLGSDHSGDELVDFPCERIGAAAIRYRTKNITSAKRDHIGNALGQSHQARLAELRMDQVIAL
jgi:hypothetical protein